MDIHYAGQIPNWHQEMIRKGAANTPARFLVNFTQAAKYKISLSRWPEESGLALGDAAEDEIEGTAFTDPRVRGKSLKFKKAYLKINEQQYSVEVDNSKKAASFIIETDKGERDLTAWFEMGDGKLTNAFYIYVEKINQ
jgi:hypothetical protein